MEWIEPCSLKINLCLWVGAAQPDGFHQVRTLFLRLPSPESLTIREIHVDNVKDRLFREGDPFSGEHLVRRTLDLLRRRGAALPPLEVHCPKLVPSGGGVGAGSGNAAALIRWAARYGFDSREPREWAELGSDVPFLAGGSSLAWGEGRGEVLDPLEGGFPCAGFLVFPRWSTPTAEAYRRLDHLRGAKRVSLPDRSEGEVLLGALRRGEPVILDSFGGPRPSSSLGRRFTGDGNRASLALPIPSSAKAVRGFFLLAWEGGERVWDESERAVLRLLAGWAGRMGSLSPRRPRPEPIRPGTSWGLPSEPPGRSFSDPSRLPPRGAEGKGLRPQGT